MKQGVSLLTLVGGEGSETGEGTRDPKGRHPLGIAGSAHEQRAREDARASGAGQAGSRPPLEPPWGTVLVTAMRAASDLWT